VERITEQIAIEKVRRYLEEAAGAVARTEHQPRISQDFADAILAVGGHRFVLEYKGVASSALVSHAVEQVKLAASHARGSLIPLVAVPFMGESGRAICVRTKTNWIDLSGNASIRAPGLVIERLGNPNLYIHRGRPSSPFAPVSARVARWFLIHPGAHVRQAELARSTGLGQGYVSRIVRWLTELGYLTVASDRTVSVVDHNRLLDDWRSDYEFSSHTLYPGHVAARSGEELIQQVWRAAAQSSVEISFTGLSGAWLYDQHAHFNITTAFIREPLDPSWLSPISFRAGAPGANVWLVLPRDRGVFDDSRSVSGISVVHPVQVYLDLKGHPERSAEAAEELRSRHLAWKSDE